jgi:hypothetical protein
MELDFLFLFLGGAGTAIYLAFMMRNRNPAPPQTDAASTPTLPPPSLTIPPKVTKEISKLKEDV